MYILSANNSSISFIDLKSGNCRKINQVVVSFYERVSLFIKKGTYCTVWVHPHILAYTRKEIKKVNNLTEVAWFIYECSSSWCFLPLPLPLSPFPFHSHFLMFCFFLSLLPRCSGFSPCGRALSVNFLNRAWALVKFDEL